MQATNGINPAGNRIFMAPKMTVAFNRLLEQFEALWNELQFE
jgi:hypothetical protein